MTSHPAHLPPRSRLPLALLVALAGCSAGRLDVGANDGGAPPAQAKSPTSPEAAPQVDCSSVPEAPIQLFQSLLDEDGPFNVSALASDATHLYIAGAGRAISNPEASKVPDPAHPMRTATLLRVPLAGGEPEVLEYARVDFTRGVAVDDENVYWACDLEESVYFRQKKGGATTALSLPGSGIASSIASDGHGNVFWGTWYGRFGTEASPIPAIGRRAPGTSVAQTFQEGKGEQDSVNGLTVDATNVYWTAGRDDLELRTAPFASGASTVLTRGVGSITYGLAADDAFVYGISSKALWRVPKSGGAVQTLATPGPGRGYGIGSFATDGKSLYFADTDYSFGEGGRYVPGSLFRADKDGSHVTTLVSGADPSNLMVDACRIYWVSFRTDGTSGVSVYSRRK